ncbi:MAG: undecaprenyl-phosphate glucose phosphotransferase [Propionivibrio sp.]
MSSENSLALSPPGISLPPTLETPARNSFLQAIEMLLEPAMQALSLCLVCLYFEYRLPPAYLILAALTFAASFPGRSRLQFSRTKMVLDIVFGWLLIAGLLALLGAATNSFRFFSEQALAVWLVAAPLSAIGAQLALRTYAPVLARIQSQAQRAIIVSMNAQGLELARRIGGTDYANIALTGFFDDRSAERLGDAGPGQFPLLGNLRDLPAFVKQHRIELIYLSMPMTSHPRIREVLDELKDTTASIYFVPDMFVTDLIQGHTDAICGMPVISVCETPFRGRSAMVKWLSDKLLASLILFLISPLLLVIALAIKLGSPGPVIFKQRRYGLNGEEILVYKFRSMTVCEDGGVIRQASRNDARITRLGAFLRKTSLDELPQFINVLQGRMSIVGPRPHAVAHNEQYRGLIRGYMLRHKVKPGITGWAQVNGHRGETDTLDKMQARVDYDIDYLRNWSLLLDLKIILRTVLVVFRDQAAY